MNEQYFKGKIVFENNTIQICIIRNKAFYSCSTMAADGKYMSPENGLFYRRVSNFTRNLQTYRAYITLDSKHKHNKLKSGYNRWTFIYTSVSINAEILRHPKSLSGGLRNGKALFGGHFRTNFKEQRPSLNFPIYRLGTFLFK